MSDDESVNDKERKERELRRRYGVDKTGKSSDSKVNWKKIGAILLAFVFVFGLFWTFKPWERFIGGSGEGENQPAGENVLFAYEAQFWYRGSEHGEPLENLYLHFPAPNIDNKISASQLLVQGWKLEYIDNENVIWLEIRRNEAIGSTTIYELKGNRADQIGILEGPILGDGRTGPAIEYQLSELYPHEQFGIYLFVVVENDEADKLTLIQAGENKKSNASYYWPKDNAENRTIDLYFHVRLSQQVDDSQFQIIEEFSRLYDNGPSSWYWLYSLDI